MIENILIDLKDNDEFDCVICDFGFANFIESTDRQYAAGIETRNRPGLTPKYAAPEVKLSRIDEHKGLTRMYR